MMNYRMLINGELAEAGSGQTLSSIAPSTGEEIASFPKGDSQDCRLAISAARKAFDQGKWPRLKFAERSVYLLKIAQLIRDKAKALAEIESQDTGKTIKQTTFIDVPTCASCFEYFSGVAELLEEEEVVVPAAAESRLLREPTGVVAAIIPWNYPLIMAAWKIAPALAAGNTVVFKPSQLASLSSLELAKIFLAALLPPGVVNIITGDGKIIGPELAANPQVDMITFTGSTQVGKEVMRLAAGNIKKIHLELGGKSPNIVFSDCDLDAAVGGSMSAIFMNQGQMCTAGSRLLLQDTIYDKFMARLVEKTSMLKLGNSLDYTTDFGPLISEAHRKKVLKAIEAGIKEGAKLILGGKIPDDEALKNGFFLKPAIFENVRNNMSICQEEIFGPVLAVIRFSTEEEAIKIANDSQYGLAAMVWTKDKEKAERVAKAIRCGTVWVNTYGGFYSETPFGGYKQSGIGRELGKAGLLEYTELKHLNRDLSPDGKPLVSNWFA